MTILTLLLLSLAGWFLLVLALGLCGAFYLYLKERALATATETAKTPKAVECEASQSGPKGNAQPLSPNSFEEQ